jgi:basic membrane protein A
VDKYSNLYYKGAPADGIIYIAPFYRLENSVPEDVKIKFNQLKDDIINGKIVVPERYNNNDNIVDVSNKN